MLNSDLLTFIDDKSYLLNYETQRQRHVVPTSAAIDGLHKLYSTDLPPVVLVRSLGLQLTNAMIPIKVFILLVRLSFHESISIFLNLF